MATAQKLSVRLLREGITPDKAVRDDVKISPWDKLEGAFISLDTLGGGSPKWAGFLELSKTELEKVYNNSALGLVFVSAENRWFCISFGLGHVKLNPDALEQDFGLRVVLNSVDPKQLKSADVRTPDENTLARRTQASRGSDQTAFSIDVERDLVRGLAGKPRDPAFGSYVSGADGLTISRKITINQIGEVCSDSYSMYKSEEYKKNFSWIDQIRHVRDLALIDALELKLVEAIKTAIEDGESDSIHLAYPVIYDPDKSNLVRFKGFRSYDLYSDLDFSSYLNALSERDKDTYTSEDLSSHSVHEVNDEGHDCGGKWKVHECIVFETEMDGSVFVISGGRWYVVETSLAQEVKDFFNATEMFDLPDGEVDENEETYNKRVAALDADMICLDRQLIKPTGSSTMIEACDFLSRSSQLIHIKDKTSSSRLSHLFNQGTVSARVLAIDGLSRDSVIAHVEAVQALTGQKGYEGIIPGSKDQIVRSDFTVLYGVIVASANPKLPFFSLISFRQAARELFGLGFKVGFSWINKPKAVAKAKAKKKKKAA